MDAEWIFFATGHCKSPCDGVGGFVKRYVEKRSLHYVTKVLSYQSMHDLCVRKIPSIPFFRVSQEEMVNVSTDLKDYFAKTNTMLGTRSSHHFVSISCNKLLTNLQVRIESFFNLISTNH